MKNYGLDRPIIETGESWFSIEFKRKPQDATIERPGAVQVIPPSMAGQNEGVNEGVTRLLNYMRLHPGLRTPAISRGLGTPVKTIERWLKNLKKEGAIQFRGSPKTGGYHALPQGGG